MAATRTTQTTKMAARRPTVDNMDIFLGWDIVANSQDDDANRTQTTKMATREQNADNQDGGLRTERRQPRWRPTNRTQPTKTAACELNAGKQNGDLQTER